VKVRIRDLDGCPISGATVETWQANGQGFYENQFPDLQPDCNLRGIFSADRAGQVHYVTVKPAGYAVPNDGPVGQLLGSIGYVPRRPAHLHFIVAADGFETITTQIFDGADPLIAEDALFNAKPDLVGDFLKEVAEDARVRWSLDFTFVMARAANPGGNRDDEDRTVRICRLALTGALRFRHPGAERCGGSRGWGAKRALVLSTPNQKGDAEALASRLGDIAAGVFAEATMHTPLEVTEQALAAFKTSGADCVVALGGGSTIGLGKAIANAHWRRTRW